MFVKKVDSYMEHSIIAAVDCIHVVVSGLYSVIKIFVFNLQTSLFYLL